MTNENKNEVERLKEQIEAQGRGSNPDKPKGMSKEQLKELDKELKELQNLLFIKTAKQAQDEQVQMLYKELINEAETIKIACENIKDLMVCAEEYGFKVGYVDTIRMFATDIHNAYIHIVSEGRLQNAGFYHTRWDFQSKRLEDYASFLHTWVSLARNTQVSSEDDSAFRGAMLRYIKKGADRISKEAQSLISFCNRYEPFDFDRKGDQ